MSIVDQTKAQQVTDAQTIEQQQAANRIEKAARRDNRKDARELEREEEQAKVESGESRDGGTRLEQAPIDIFGKKLGVALNPLRVKTIIQHVKTFAEVATRNNTDFAEVRKATTGYVVALDLLCKLEGDDVPDTLTEILKIIIANRKEAFAPSIVHRFLDDVTKGDSVRAQHHVAMNNLLTVAASFSGADAARLPEMIDFAYTTRYVTNAASKNAIIAYFKR